MGSFILGVLLCLTPILLVGWTSLRVRAAGYRGSAGGPPIPVEEPEIDPATQATLSGGARIGRRNATWPFGKLRLDRRWACISATYAGVAWVDRELTTGVRIVWGPMGTGVLFRSTDDRYAGVVFWTFSVAPVREVLTERGWPVLD